MLWIACRRVGRSRIVLEMSCCVLFGRERVLIGRVGSLPSLTDDLVRISSEMEEYVRRYYLVRHPC
jgi:hypothetical protein